ncbi:MAG: hypothetical protein IPN33_05605 [Saprospiraceae bacterium]|nr:hypothetical protein [Saprospiraceae bacterium]
MYEKNRSLFRNYVCICSRTYCGLNLGDNCSNAINLGAQTGPYSSTTTGLADDTQLSCLSGSPTVFYIDVPAGQGLQIGQIWNNYDSNTWLLTVCLARAQQK